MTKLMINQNRNGLSRMIDEMFNDFGFAPTVAGRETQTGQPRVNIIENDEQVRLVFEVPGMKKDDFKVVIKDGNLIVSGERKFELNEEKDRYVHREIGNARFSRSFTLSDKINTESVTADYNQGLLTISLAKQEEAKPKEIEISVG